MNPYNLSKFNIPNNSGQEPEIIMNCYEKCDVTITFGINSEIIFISTEKLNINSLGSLSYIESFNLNEKIDLSTILTLGILEKLLANENLKLDSYISENINLKYENQEKMKNNFYLGLDTEFDINTNEKINTKFDLLKDIIMNSYSQNEIISLIVSSYILDKKSFLFDLEIKPGETLKINSDNFTAYLNDKNVLSSFQGDWIELSRELIDVTISGFATKDQINGNIIFKERYL